MYRIISWLLIAGYVISFFCSNAYAQIAVLSVDANKVEEVVKQGMKDLSIPGLSLGIVKGDEVIYLEGYGIADNNSRPVTPQTPFILGSVSKSFTALAIMQLAEQGKINLDGDVQQYLPWLRLNDPAEDRAVTIRNLLNQTSGISSLDGRGILNAGNKSLEEVARQQSHLKLSEPVGSAFQYSNTNYIILGAIVQSVSGMSYEQFVEEQIFSPLEMKHSFARRSEAQANGLASGYQFVFGKMVSTNPKLAESSIPAGYLMSSAEDMTHYLIAQISGGQYRDASILSIEGIRSMHQRSDVFPYGMGWYTDSQMISHGGDSENFHSDVMIDSESGLGLVVLMNTNDALKTKLYGPVYQQLSYSIMNLISNEKLFHGSIPLPAKFGDIDMYINIMILIVLIWVAWSVYSLFNNRKRRKAGTVRFAIHHITMIFLNVIMPLVILLQVPIRLKAPWMIILKFMPGAGHALLVLPILLLVVGLLKCFVLSRRVRYSRNRRLFEFQHLIQ